ncbi:MAG TPA: hypothetical protein PK637_06150 [Flavobacteriales bacterium]|nr:hypothetical protein [Flavobacteriales bacterium]HRE96327.1 hypothetical protein [Flavobacteriales bacterium]HRJ37838.1 hypothetical protein [Flavobacteriales bacterium]
MKRILFVALSALFIACGSGNEPEARTEEKLRQEIKAMEDSLFGSTAAFNKEAAEKMIALYMDFANEFPKAKEAPDYLLKAADVATAVNKPRIKEDCYKRIIENYPDFNRLDAVKYLLAFTLDAELNNREEAKTWYNEVIKTVKDTNFVRDSKVRMNTIDSLNYDQFIEMIISNPQPVQ